MKLDILILPFSFTVILFCLFKTIFYLFEGVGKRAFISCFTPQCLQELGLGQAAEGA